MRIGYHLATALESEKQLFEDEELSLLVEEMWHKDCADTAYGIPTTPLQPKTLPPPDPPDLSGTSTLTALAVSPGIDKALTTTQASKASPHQVWASSQKTTSAGSR